MLGANDGLTSNLALVMGVAGAPGWSVGRVAEVAGLSQREVSDAIRASSVPGSHGDIRPDDSSLPARAMRSAPSARRGLTDAAQAFVA